MRGNTNSHYKILEKMAKVAQLKFTRRNAGRKKP